MNISTVFAMCILIFCFHFADAESVKNEKENFSPGPQYKKFCDGKIDELVDDALQTPYGDPYYIERHIFILKTEAGVNKTLALMDHLPEDYSKIPEGDRVVFASALMRSNSDDIISLEKLLLFRSKDPIIESYRLLVEAEWDIINDHRDQALKKLMNSFDNLPFFNGAILEHMFAIGRAQKNTKELLKPYLAYVGRLPEGSPLRTLMEIHKASYAREVSDKELLDRSRNAFETCPRDESLLLRYSYSLNSLNQNPEAEKLLIGAIKLNKYYSNQIDLILAKIYLEESSKENAKFYLQRAESRSRYFNLISRGLLEDLQWKFDLKYYYLPIVAFIFIVGAIAFTFVLYRRRRKAD